MKVAIIKYNAGNVCSVDYALRRLGVEAVITDDKEIISKSDKVIFPGVGSADSAMTYLRERGLDTFIKELKQPVLGICLGMQLMCSFSEEGDVDCMGIFPVKVKRFEPKMKVPHMGWNNLEIKKPGIILDGVDDGSWVYFVHSYRAKPKFDDVITAESDYGVKVPAVVEKNNFFGTQFHPEKSGDVGKIMIQNFLNVCKK